MHFPIVLVSTDKQGYVLVTKRQQFPVDQGCLLQGPRKEKGEVTAHWATRNQRRREEELHAPSSSCDPPVSRLPSDEHIRNLEEMADKKRKSRDVVKRGGEKPGNGKSRKISANKKNIEGGKGQVKRTGPRLPNPLFKEIDRMNPNSWSDDVLDEDVSFDGGKDLYEYEEEVPEEEVKNNHCFDNIKNFEYELPEDFKDEIVHSDEDDEDSVGRRSCSDVEEDDIKHKRMLKEITGMPSEAFEVVDNNEDDWKGDEKRQTVNTTIVAMAVLKKNEKSVVLTCDGRSTFADNGCISSDVVVKVHQIGRHFLVGTAGDGKTCKSVVKELLEVRFELLRGPASCDQIKNLKIFLNEYLEDLKSQDYDVETFGLIAAGLDGDGDPRLWEYDYKKKDTSEQYGFYCDGTGAVFADWEIDGALKPRMGRTKVVDIAFRSIYRAALNDNCTGGLVTTMVLGNKGNHTFTTNIKELADLYGIHEPGTIFPVGHVFDWTPLWPMSEKRMLRFLMRIKEGRVVLGRRKPIPRIMLRFLRHINEMKRKPKQNRKGKRGNKINKVNEEEYRSESAAEVVQPVVQNEHLEGIGEEDSDDDDDGGQMIDGKLSAGHRALSSYEIPSQADLIREAFAGDDVEEEFAKALNVEEAEKLHTKPGVIIEPINYEDVDPHKKAQHSKQGDKKQQRHKQPPKAKSGVKRQKTKAGDW